jgi:hypothetical protein
MFEHPASCFPTYTHANLRGLPEAAVCHISNQARLGTRKCDTGRAASSAGARGMDLPLRPMYTEGSSYQGVRSGIQSPGVHFDRRGTFLAISYRTGFLIAPALY